mgnify:FL=1
MNRSQFQFLVSHNRGSVIVHCSKEDKPTIDYLVELGLLEKSLSKYGWGHRLTNKGDFVIGCLKN